MIELNFNSWILKAGLRSQLTKDWRLWQQESVALFVSHKKVLTNLGYSDGGGGKKDVCWVARSIRAT